MNRKEEMEARLDSEITRLENGEDHDEGAFDADCEVCAALKILRDVRAALRASAAPEEVNHFEETSAGVIDWKMEAERANRLLAALAPATEGGGREKLAELICEELTGEKTCTDAGNWPAPLYAQSVNKWCAEIAAKILSPSPSVGTPAQPSADRKAGK